MSAYYFPIGMSFFLILREKGGGMLHSLNDITCMLGLHQLN